MICSASATFPGAPGERTSCPTLSLGRTTRQGHSPFSTELPLQPQRQTLLTRMVSLFNGKLLDKRGSVRTGSSVWPGRKKEQKNKSVFQKEKYPQPSWRELGLQFLTGEDSHQSNDVESDGGPVWINESSLVACLFFSPKNAVYFL